MFEVSAAKREILRKLAKQDWSPTDLAEELDKSPETIYNHLHDLEELGILTKTEVPAKTRPKTLYSIGDGLIQYVTVLPGQFKEGSLKVTETKAAMFRIWAIPQDEFHSYLERYWWGLYLNADIQVEKHIAALGVYGSVARGDANADSDIDIIIITPDKESSDLIEKQRSSIVVRKEDKSRMVMSEVYTEQEYRNSLAHGSDFLNSIRGELHPIYDPDRILIQPEKVVSNE